MKVGLGLVEEGGARGEERRRRRIGNGERENGERERKVKEKWKNKKCVKGGALTRTCKTQPFTRLRHSLSVNIIPNLTITH